MKRQETGWKFLWAAEHKAVEGRRFFLLDGMGGHSMFKKGMRVAMGVVGILSLACAAAAGDLMQWYPRTPAGGGVPGNLQVYLNQAAAVEYGPEAVVNRQLTGESRQGNVLSYSTSGTSKQYNFNSVTEELYLSGETVNDQNTVQRQETVIYYSK